MLETFNREEKSLTIRSNFASKAFLEKLNSWREKNLFIDVVLCADGVELSAHKVILSSCSPYFEAMFCGNFSEQHSKSDGKISIGGVTGPALKSIMDYIYSGILKVTIENAPELLQIADLLLLEQVNNQFVTSNHQSTNLVFSTKFYPLLSAFSNENYRILLTTPLLSSFLFGKKNRWQWNSNEICAMAHSRPDPPKM